MRLATVLHQGEERVAIAEGDEALLLPEAAGDMVALIEAGRPAIEALIPEATRVALADLHFLPPLRRFRRDILCTGWNYWAHFDESKGKREGQDVDRPSAPTFFTKSPWVAAGPFDDLPIDPWISKKWDYEAEVGVVFGKTFRNADRATAMETVFGFVLANDVSQRDLQRRHGAQWLKGKSIDGTMPFGPWIVTPDELDLERMELSLELNGQVMQSARLAQMAFDIPELIAELSFGMTIAAGDLLITGTPAGIGNAREPPIFLAPGDEMVVRATGLGELRNRLVSSDLHEASSVAEIGG